MTIILGYIDVMCAMRCVHLVQVAALVKAGERTWDRCSTVIQKVEASDKMESGCMHRSFISLIAI